ncbi:methyltransferase family protein [Methanobacterium oryzae]|uniref:methyltransferase family protein n=1 Tax=Methanobacterium oryzae TaxID=69540 RepID=UPI003D1BB5C9
MIESYILIYLFLALFLIYSYLGLYVSRRYGAKIVGWPTAIKSRDYTLFLLAIPEVGLILNVVIIFNKEIYYILPVLAGFTIMIFGMIFNLIVRTNLGKNWVPLSKTTENQELVTEGIYSKIRHPFYLSILILFLGIAVISWNLYGLSFFILTVLAIIVRINKEEGELIAKFGEKYEKYIKETPMLIPKLK